MEEGNHAGGDQAGSVLVTFTNPLGLRLGPPSLFVIYLSPFPLKVFCKLLETEMALTPSSELALSGEERVGKL